MRKFLNADIRISNADDRRYDFICGNLRYIQRESALKRVFKEE